MQLTPAVVEKHSTMPSLQTSATASPLLGTALHSIGRLIGADLGCGGCVVAQAGEAANNAKTINLSLRFMIIHTLHLTNLVMNKSNSARRRATSALPKLYKAANFFGSLWSMAAKSAGSTGSILR